MSWTRGSIVAAPCLALILALGGACSDETGPGLTDGGSDLPQGGPCAMDKNVDPSTAQDLAASTDASGFICPVGDTDYYKITVPEGQLLVTVKLQYITPAPLLQLGYRLLDASEQILETVAPSDTNRINATHCVPKGGTYYIAVADDGADDQDTMMPYNLSYSTAAAKDTDEPNDDQASATPISGSVTSYISCRGDVDFFSFSAGPDDLVQIELSAAEPTPVDLQYTLYDSSGRILGTDHIPDGMKPGSSLSTLIDVWYDHEKPAAGATYYVAVQDAGDDDGDPDHPYTLKVSLKQESDINDQGTRNDTPAHATSLGTLPTTAVKTGQIGSQADVDWFVVNGGASVSQSNPAVIEVILELGAGQVELDPAFSIVYADGQSPCTKDACCHVLGDQACSGDQDCLRGSSSCVAKGDAFCQDKACTPDYTSVCPTQRVCAGAAICLPASGGRCAATQMFRRAQNKTDAVVIKTSQLLVHPGPYYIRVEDHQNNEYENGRNYTLRVRAELEPDGIELDNELFPDRCMLYEPQNQYLEENELSLHLAQAKPSMPTISLGQWVTGHLSYEGDMDFYKLPNPCPDADCNLQITFGTQGTCPSSGAPLRDCQNPNELKNAMGLEFMYMLRRSSGKQWTGVKTAPNASGTFGDNECVYSPVSHGSDYYIVHIEDDGHNSWSLDCQYRFMITKTDGCNPPCVFSTEYNKCGL